VPSAIKRIQLTDGTLYESEQPWPGVDQSGVDDAHKLKVFQMTFLPGREEDDDTEEEDDSSGTSVHLPQFEIWGLTDRAFAVLMADLQGKEVPDSEVEYLKSMKTVTRRLVSAAQVRIYDEEWDVGSGIQEVKQRIFDWNMQAQEDMKRLQEQREKAQAAKQNGQPAQGAAPPAPAT